MYAVLDALPVYEAYATDVPMLVLDNAESLEATGLICMQSEFSYEEGQCEKGKASAETHSWSVDGKAVVIDYANFQSSYMYEQQEIFKTSNMRSFIRQLNLYGFRKVSPHDRVMAQYSSSTRGNTTSSGIHAFRNESFVRGRPDLLRRVTRKAGPPRAKRPRKVASGYQSSGSSTSSLSDEARRTQRQVPHSIMDCEADDTPSDMIALLDPNEPPTAVFTHFSPSPSGWEHAPRLEDCLLLSPVLSCLGQTPSDELSRLLMTDDDEDQDGTSGADQDQVLPAADASERWKGGDLLSRIRSAKVGR
ncbi:hypothetical protein ISCGN_021143, partial [Ixodes scapularis]